MKLTTGHWISLGLNVVLISVLLMDRVERHNERSLHSEPAPVRTAVSPARSTSPAAPPHAASLPVIAPGSDWRQWLEPLRTAGVPTPVLATLIREDFDRRWQARQEEMQKKYMAGTADADALAAFALEHDIRLEEETRAALGEEAYRRWDMERILQGLNLTNVTLSDSERDAVYDLERRKREEARAAEKDKLEGKIDQANMEARQRAAEEQANQRLRALLGEQRAATLQGAAVDDTLGNLKRSLNETPVSDAQLQELANIQREWDRKRSELATLETNTQDPSYTAALREAEEKWRADLQRVLGPDGYERFLKGQDSRYAEMQRHAKSWNLSPAEIDHVFSTLTNFEEAVREYDRDARTREISRESVRETVDQFAQQTEQSLQQNLGPDRYETLKRNGVAPTATP